MFEKIKNWIVSNKKKVIIGCIVVVLVTVLAVACSSLDGVDTIQYGMSNYVTKEVKS